MEKNNKYYGLDEIGFVGTQNKRTSAQINRDIQRTVKYIKTTKSEKVVSELKKTKKESTKA